MLYSGVGCGSGTDGLLETLAEHVTVCMNFLVTVLVLDKRRLYFCLSGLIISPFRLEGLGFSDRGCGLGFQGLGVSGCKGSHGT